MPGQRYTIVVADDSDVYREGIARAIRAHPSLELLAEAATGDEALEAIRAFHPDVALLDVRMPGLDGLEVCELVSRDTAVVLLSAYLDDHVVERARSLGSSAYLSKSISRREICAAAVSAASGARLPA